MKRVVLDTNVASYFMAESPEFSLYEPATRGCAIEISFQTVAEILDGARSRGFGGKKWRALFQFLETDVDVVPYSLDLAQEYAQARDLSRRRGRELSAPDAWIAATAIHRKAQLLTHDTDFLGLKIPGLHVVCFA